MHTREDPYARHRLPYEPNARVKVAVVLASVAVVGAFALYGLGSEEASSPAVAAPGSPLVPVAPPSPELPVVPTPQPDPAASPIGDDLAASFQELSSGLDAQIGFAYAPLGQPDRVTLLGDWSSGPAWSTIKVPLALALLRETGTSSSAMQSAITVSDNAAAQSMWEQLGGGDAAAGKIEEVLAEAGNPATDVPSELRRAGFSIFGQTDWSLADQARFLARTACDPQAAPVTDLMGQIASGQQWGLGTIDGTYFKGGWGPGTDGLYLVRQFGVVPTPTGRVAVALAAVANSGAFGDGTTALSRIATWVQEHAGDLDAGECQVG